MKHTKLIATALLAGAFVLGPNASAEDKKTDKKPAVAKKAAKGRPLPGALGKLDLSADEKNEISELMKDVSAKRREAGRNKELQAQISKDYKDKLAEILGEKRSAELNKLNETAKNRSKGSKKSPNSKKKK